MSMLRLFIRYGYVPFMMLGVNGVALWLIASGHSYFWTAAAMLFGAIGLSSSPNRSCLMRKAGIARTKMPARTSRMRRSTRSRTSTAHCCYRSSLCCGPGMNTGRPSGRSYSILFAVVVTDIGLTLLHYISHKLPLLWRLHAIHHGVHRVYGFNGFIRHPLHQIVDLTLSSLPLALLGHAG